MSACLPLENVRRLLDGLFSDLVPIVIIICIVCNQFFWKTSCEEAVAAITWLNQTLIGIRDVSVSFIFSEQIFAKACVLNADD